MSVFSYVSCFWDLLKHVEWNVHSWYCMIVPWMNLSQFTHSNTDGYLGYMYFGATKNNAIEKFIHVF